MQPQPYKNLFIGIDLGSSFIKLSIIDEEQTVRAEITVPEQQMKIESLYEGWAQQDPQLWWQCVKAGLKKLLKNPEINPQKISGIGLSYQMHGLVLIDSNLQPLRKSIIWCDSRTTEIGQKLHQQCMQKGISRRIMNHPSNFTLAKMLWVRGNQGELWARVWKVMLPGDYIVMRLTGRVQTTVQGLSEATLWDFQNNTLCTQLLQLCDLSPLIIPEITPNFTPQSMTTPQPSLQLQLPPKTPIFYRSGDQPNNAFALNVLQPGEVAATAGTSGVLYAISEAREKQEGVQFLRFNSFAHVDYGIGVTKGMGGIGRLLCINGCGIVYQWLRRNFFENLTYQQMNEIAYNNESQDLILIPLGNGSERMLLNQSPKCHLLNLCFTRHTKQHVIRAAVEGVAFSFIYGARIMRERGIRLERVRAGRGNFFECRAFGEIVATLLGVEIEVGDTRGAEGAAKGALLGYLLGSDKEAWRKFKINTKIVSIYRPQQTKKELYENLYRKWLSKLEQILK